MPCISICCKTLADSVTLLCLFLALHILVLPYLCSNLPFSLYFNPELHRELPDDNIDLTVPEGVAEEPRDESIIAVLLLTSPRDQGYLSRTMLALYKELTISPFRHKVYTCTADTDHAELMDMMNNIPGMVVMQPCTQSYCAQFTSEQKEQKYIHDFTVCHKEVEEDLEGNVELILVMEDDVMVMPNIFSTLSSTLNYNIRRLTTAPWLDIKLYKPPRLRGYAWDTEPLIELLATSWLLALLLDLVLTRARIRIPKNYLHRYLILYCMVIVTLLTISRQHVMQWRRIHPQLYAWHGAPNFGTQAVLYNRTNLRDAVDYLKKGPSKSALDFALSNFRHKNGLKGFLLEPNLVRHIGVSSSMGGKHQVDRDKGDLREFMVNYSI